MVPEDSTADRPAGAHAPITADQWDIFTHILQRVSGGWLTPEEVPAARHRSEASGLLDVIEAQLFSPAGRPQDDPARVAADLARLRLARYVAEDVPAKIVQLLRMGVAHAPPGSRIPDFLRHVTAAVSIPTPDGPTVLH